MFSSISSTFPAIMGLLTLGSAKYSEKEVFAGESFFSNFTFFTEADPTKGTVSYISEADAISSSLIGMLSNGHIYMGVDHTSKIPANAGRPSVRIESKATFNHGLLLADISHMPDSTCGTWPAFWMLGKGMWPTNGEIDILEGVNDEDRNAVTLHTTLGCVVSDLNPSEPLKGSPASLAKQRSRRQNPGFAGELKTSDCDINASGQDKNAGCSIHAPEKVPGNDSMPLNSYGTEFNKAGGGIYAMEYTSSGITVWFLPYNASSDFSSPTHPATVFSDPKPETWGVPMAKFAGDGCDWDARFSDLRIIFDTTFCGEWAGRVWDESCKEKTGVETCEAYVRDNPEAFKEVWWGVGRLVWYDEEQ
jgi:hypothetical protein